MHLLKDEKQEYIRAGSNTWKMEQWRIISTSDQGLISKRALEKEKVMEVNKKGKALALNQLKQEKKNAAKRCRTEYTSSPAITAKLIFL